jgi:excisionase family DNA binding protein
MAGKVSIDGGPTLSITDLGTYLGCSRATVYRLLEAGELPPPQRLSERRVFFRREVIDEWLASRPVAA